MTGPEALMGAIRRRDPDAVADVLRALPRVFPLYVHEVEPATAVFLHRLRSDPALVEELWSAPL